MLPVQFGVTVQPNPRLERAGGACSRIAWQAGLGIW
jgi:hypothetical protein